MKKVLMSLFSIAVVSAMITGGAVAYFSDTETSTGNTFTAGTIDIEICPVDGQIVETITEDLDLKPCETGYIDFTVTNTGTNPVVVWKHLGNIVCTGGIETDAELEANPGGQKHNIDTVIEYDLEVDGVVIFSVDDGLTVSDIASMWMPLGTLAPDACMKVKQSYHMKADTGNWAQGDIMTFDIDIYGEQLLGNGPLAKSSQLFLDNKTAAWDFIPDGTWAILDYSLSGSGGGATMTYDLKAKGLTPGTTYKLIYYPEPNPWPPTGIRVIGTHTALADGTIDATYGSPTTLPTDANAKIWLVLGSDIAGGSMSAWNGISYLFEANKINIP